MKTVDTREIGSGTGRMSRKLKVENRPKDFFPMDVILSMDLRIFHGEAPDSDSRKLRFRRYLPPKPG